MKTNWKIVIGFAAAILIYIIVGLVLKDQRAKSLRENKEVVKGVVSEYYSISFSYYYKYEFSVDGKIYTGSERRNPKSEYPCIGDSILIEYDVLYPNNNKAILQ